MKNRGVFVRFGLGLVGGVIMSKAQKNGLEYGYRVIFGVDQSTHSSSRRSVGAVGTAYGAVACNWQDCCTYVDLRTQRSLLQAIQHDIVYFFKFVLLVVISDRCFTDAGWPSA